MCMTMQSGKEKYCPPFKSHTVAALLDNLNLPSSGSCIHVFHINGNVIFLICQYIDYPFGASLEMADTCIKRNSC